MLNIYRSSQWLLAKPIVLGVASVILPTYFLATYGLWSEYKRVVILWAGLVVLILGRIVVIWFLNRYLITNQRFVKISHAGLFKKIVSETPLERILNVSYKTTGINSALGRFGDVEVQVVGLVEPIILKDISHPSQIKDYLWKLHLSHEPEKQQSRDAIEHLQEHIGYTKQNQRIL